MELEAAQVAFVGRHRFGPLPPRGGDIGFLEPAHHRRGDMPDDLVHGIEQRFERPFDPLTPDDVAFASFSERKIDPHSRSALPQRPGENIADAQRLADRDRIAVFIFQHGAGGARADKQAAETAKLQDQIFRHAIGEETDFVVSGRGQRDDGDRVGAFLAVRCGFGGRGLKNESLLLAAQAINRDRF